MYLHERQTTNKTNQSQKYIRTDIPHPQNSKSMELCFSRSLLLTEPTVTDKLKGITESLKSVDLGKKNLTDEDEILYVIKLKRLPDLNIALAFTSICSVLLMLKDKRKRFYTIKVTSVKHLKFSVYKCFNISHNITTIEPQ